MWTDYIKYDYENVTRQVMCTQHTGICLFSNRKLRPYYIKTLRAGFFLVLQKMPCYAKA